MPAPAERRGPTHRPRIPGETNPLDLAAATLRGDPAAFDKLVDQSPHPPTDHTTALVKAVQTGDRQAYEKLMGELSTSMGRYTSGRMGRRIQNTVGGPEDVAQEVMLAVVAAMPGYTVQTGKSFRAFVYGIGSHKVADAFRAIGRNRSEPLADFPEEVQHGDAPDPEEAAIKGEQVKEMVGLLHRLTPRQREVLVLRLGLSLPAEEVAYMIGSTPGAVRVTQHRALNKIRRLGKEEGFDLSDDATSSQEPRERSTLPSRRAGDPLKDIQDKTGIVDPDGPYTRRRWYREFITSPNALIDIYNNGPRFEPLGAVQPEVVPAKAEERPMTRTERRRYNDAIIGRLHAGDEAAAPPVDVEATVAAEIADASQLAARREESDAATAEIRAIRDAVLGIDSKPRRQTRARRTREDRTSETSQAVTDATVETASDTTDIAAQTQPDPPATAVELYVAPQAEPVIASSTVEEQQEIVGVSAADQQPEEQLTTASSTTVDETPRSRQNPEPQVSNNGRRRKPPVTAEFVVSDGADGGVTDEEASDLSRYDYKNRVVTEKNLDHTFVPRTPSADVLGQLNTTQRDILIMHDQDGLPIGEIADVIGMSQRDVRNTLAEINRIVAGPTE